MRKIFFIIIIICTAQAYTQIYTSVETINGIPTICKNLQPYSISGWTIATLTGYNELSAKKINDKMDTVLMQGYQVVEVFVPWGKVETIHGQYSWEKIDSIIDHSEQIGIYTIIQVNAALAPAWFADSLYPDGAFTTYDPDSLLHPGEMWGHLYVQGIGSSPIFYHPGYYQEVGAFLTQLINRYKNRPNHFGWTLGLWFTGEYNYPGGGYGIAGYADYSAFTQNLYGSAPPLPLNMFTQAGPDTRNNWQSWTMFRIIKKRESLQYFSSLVKSLDPNHILIGYPGCFGMWGELDNGYIAEVGAADYFSMLTDINIDVVRGAPQVSENLFKVSEGEISLIPYLMIGNIAASYRNGKPFLLQCERSSDTTSLVNKISVWAQFHKSLGSELIWWEEPSSNNISGIWTPLEKEEIGNAVNITQLPSISAITKSDFAFIDLPFESGKYYADNTFSLLYAMKQEKAFMDAGLPFDIISAEEIISNPSFLNKYKAIGFLFPDMYNFLAPANLKAIINDYIGVIWNGSPLDGYNYYSSAYTDTLYLNNLRSFYDSNNLIRNKYFGHFIYIAGNKPFIFMFSRDNNFSGDISVNIKGWNLPEGSINLLEYNSGNIYPAFISGDTINISVSLEAQQPYLFILHSPTNVEDNNEFSVINLTNYPNPFNPTTTINFSLAQHSYVTLKVFDLLGREIETLVDGELFSGKHSVIFNAKDLASGIYFCRLQFDKFFQQKKMTVLK